MEQQQQQENIPQPPPEPPNVKVIECPCSQADQRSPDFSTWTNILNEPIEIRKGSEVRIVQSFIDMRGMDQDIIQFQSKGNNQDNSHTMLFQHYTTNDGFNNKTCTYDYISSGDPKSQHNYIPYGGVIDPGQLYWGNNPRGVSTAYKPTWNFISDAGENFSDGKLVYNPVNSHGIRPKNITIVNGGKNYNSGDRFKITGANNNDFFGYVVCDDVGAIKQMIFTKPHGGDPGNAPYGVNFYHGTNGTDATFALTFTTQPAVWDSFASARDSGNRGTKFKVGDTLIPTTSFDGQAVNEDNQASFSVTNIYLGPGAVNDEYYFDQGYNYERTPVYRWCQSLSINTAFCYGNRLSRSYTTHGNPVDITLVANPNDPSLSAGQMIMNQEDEFVSGVFHTPKDEDTFEILCPVMEYHTTSNQSFTISAAENRGWKLTSQNFDMRDFPNTIGNDFNVMPPGSVWQFYFEYTQITPTADQLVALEPLSSLWGNIMRVKSFTPKITGTEVILDSDLKDTEYVGVVTEIRHIINTPGFPQSATTDYTLILKTADTGNLQNVNPPIISVTANGAGLCTSYVIKDGGTGNRKGMCYQIGDPAVSHTIATQIDGVSGWDFSASRNKTLTNADLVVDGNQVRMCIIPVQNWSRFGTSGNSLRFGNEIVNSEGARYPVKFTNQAPEKDQIATNYLYLPSSDEKSINHNKTTIPKVVSELQAHQDPTTIGDRKRYYQFVVNYNQNEFYGYGDTIDPNDYWYDSPNSSDPGLMRLAKDFFSQEHLPLNRFVDIVGYKANNESMVECQVQTGGLHSHDNNYWYITVITPDAVGTDYTLFKLSTAANNLAGNVYAKQQKETMNNLNGFDISKVVMTYAVDPKEFNTSIELNWNKTTGTLAITGQQNFFNTDDININSEQVKTKIIPNTSQAQRDKYDKGGFYYLSSSQTNSFNTANFFNHGYDNLLLAQLSDQNWEFRNSGIVANQYNNQRQFTSASRLWNYEPLLREKSITITKDFCSPSDVAGIWANQAHSLSGATNNIDGTEYVSAKSSGILQNPFIMPVYGANNRIGLDGQYIVDNIIYQETGGLEGGHTKGIQYIHSDNNWLAKTLILQLPEDKDGNKYYDVFFRTGFTLLRGYDPLKEHQGNPALQGLPDKSYLTTVSTAIDNVGNKGILSLDGQIIGGGPPATATALYDLGRADGNAPGNTIPSFDRTSNYPIYYLDPTKRSHYPKAKISQYIGTQNVVLAFDGNISSFVFEYLHTPYTSPFIDGQGGQESVRVFYGNRLDGIVNHETLGGVLVLNYCRPSYQRTTFTPDEILENPTSHAEYPYGIDPLRSTEFVGRQFLNKMGFTDSDLGIDSTTGQILTDNNVLSFKNTQYNMTIDATTTDGEPHYVPFSYYQYKSFDTEYYGTTGANLDGSDAILTQIESPETSASIETYNRVVTPKIGQNRNILQKFGDYIFYPYSINTATNSFNKQQTGQPNIIRFDNASTTYGSVGGLKYSNSNRGMGLPNTLGSTMICDDETIPVTLNPDCELYLAYTIQTTSSIKKASLLPVKLTNAYLIILSSLFKQPNLYMAKSGFINGGAIVNKTFITGDFILSDGITSFYAPEDMVLTSIETQIKDSNYGVPSTLGLNSSVIYSITDYNPAPATQLPTVGQQQEQDMAIMQMVNQHMANPKTSKLEQLHQDFYELGLDLMTNQTSDIIDAVRNQINAHDLVGMTPQQKVQFLKTPEGQILLSNAADVQSIREHIKNIEMYEGTPSEYSVTQRERGNISARRDAILKRTPIYYFQLSADPEDESPRPDPLFSFKDQLPQRLTPYGPTEPAVEFEETPELTAAMGEPINPVLAEYIDKGKGTILPEDKPHAREIAHRYDTPKGIREKLKTKQQKEREQAQEQARERFRQQRAERLERQPIRLDVSQHYSPEELQRMEDYASSMGYGEEVAETEEQRKLRLRRAGML